MPKPLEERLNNIDINSLSDVDRDKHLLKLKTFVENKIKQTMSEMKSVLGIYGLEFQMLFEVTKEGDSPTWNNVKKPEAPKKPSAPRKPRKPKEKQEVESKPVEKPKKTSKKKIEPN